MDNKKQLVETILEAVRQEVEQFVEEEGKITSSVEYEDRVLAICRKFGRSLIETSQGGLPKSRNGKKKFWQVWAA